MIFWGLGQWVGAGWVQESPDRLQQQNKESDSEVASAVNTTVSTVAVQPTWRPRPRPVLPAIVTILATHSIGLLAFVTINTTWFLQYQVVCLLFVPLCRAHPALASLGLFVDPLFGIQPRSSCAACMHTVSPIFISTVLDGLAILQPLFGVDSHFYNFSP